MKNLCIVLNAFGMTLAICERQILPNQTTQASGLLATSVSKLHLQPSPSRRINQSSFFRLCQ